MNLSDITKINFGAAGISAVYNGGIKLWPTGTVADNKVMKFTIVSGDTWNNTHISAYTADNRLITPIKKDATGWTYPEEVGYLDSNHGYSNNLLTFEGFPQAVKLKAANALFNGCSRCTDISTANMDTSECTSMKSMFRDCSSLTSLDVSNFDTSKATDMSYMFSSCDGLTSLNLSNWDTSKVTDMSNMFNSCYGLTSLDLSGWNMVSVTSMSDIIDMFYSCDELKTVKMTNCSQETKYKIRAALDEAGLTSVVITE